MSGISTRIPEVQLRAAQAGGYEAFARGSQVKLFRRVVAASSAAPPPLMMNLPTAQFVGHMTTSMRSLGEITAIATAGGGSTLAALAVNPTERAGVAGNSGIVIVDTAAATPDRLQQKVLTHSGTCACPTFSPHSNAGEAAVLAYSYDNNVCFASGDGGMWRQTAEGLVSKSQITAMAWSPAGSATAAELLAVGSKTGVVCVVNRSCQVLDGKEWSLLATDAQQQQQQIACTALCWSHSGEHILSGYSNGVVLLSSVKNGEILARYAHSSDAIRSLAFSRSTETTILAASATSAYVFASTTAGTMLGTLNESRGAACAGAAWLDLEKGSAAVAVTRGAGRVGGQIYLCASTDGATAAAGAVAAAASPALALAQDPIDVGGIVNDGAVAWSAGDRALLVGIDGATLRVLWLRPAPVETVALESPVQGLSLAKSSAYLKIVGRGAQPPSTPSPVPNRATDHVAMLLCDARDKTFLVPARASRDSGVTAVCPSCQKNWSDSPPPNWLCDCRVDKRVACWIPDTDKCQSCGAAFGRIFGESRHHGRCCGRCLCPHCTSPPEQVVWLADAAPSTAAAAASAAAAAAHEKSRVCWDCLGTRGVVMM